MGVAITLGLLAAFPAIAWAFGGLATLEAGERQLWEYREAGFAVVALLVGYLPTARRRAPFVGSTSIGVERVSSGSVGQAGLLNVR